MNKLYNVHPAHSFIDDTRAQVDVNLSDTHIFRVEREIMLGLGSSRSTT